MNPNLTNLGDTLGPEQYSFLFDGNAQTLDHVLVSQDGGWYDVGQPSGHMARSYEVLFTDFLPALRARDFSAAELDTLMVRNPANAFAVAVRTTR